MSRKKPQKNHRIWERPPHTFEQGINDDCQFESCIIGETLDICFSHKHLVQNGLGHIFALRKEIEIRTLFNLLDPLINAAGASVQVLSVYKANLTETMATVLKNLRIQRGFVVYGKDTLDEISFSKF